MFSSGIVVAQTRLDTTIKIAPVSGGDPSDQVFFYDNLAMEVMAKGYTIVENITEADYTLQGTLNDYYDDWDDETYKVLGMALIDESDGHEVVNQEIVFAGDPTETYSILPTAVFSIFANIPLTKLTAVPDTELWRNKWIYISGNLGISPRFYLNEDAFSFNFTFQGGLEAELQFLYWMALEAGFDLSIDNAAYLKEYGSTELINFRTPILAIQAALKFPLKPGKTFMIEPYFGAAYNMPMSSETTPSNFSVMAGLDYGVKAGEGCLFLGFSYGIDLEKTILDPLRTSMFNNPITDYRRMYLSLTLGYKYGFINRPERKIK
jgi:hypothetical protein